MKKMLENDHEPNDMSFIGWPDIVTLEDAANMLRNFNSVFESGEFGTEDDFSWSLFPYFEQDGPSKEINTNSSSVNESNYSSYVSSTTELQMRNHKDQHLENCGSYNDCAIGFHSLGYLQTNTPFSQPGTKSISNGATNQVVPETSCLSSLLEETTLEASRLNQLQQVMNQLDTRMKLCLRDGLYRLARSAEQRHTSASANGRNEETDESNDLMDIETETNPIDRTIAHLLFHRSSDPSGDSACDGLSLMSHAIVDGLI